MEKIQVKGVEVTFNDLTEEVQKSLYLKDKEKFQLDAAKSKYSIMRNIIASDEATNLEVLDEMFKAELEIWENVDIIRIIWNHKNFKRSEDKIKALAKLKKRSIRELVAKCEDSSSECLNEMLRNELKNEEFNYQCVVETILANPKFQMEPETLKFLTESEEWEYRLIAARREDVTSECLNKMLRKEVEEDQDYDVERAILDNPKFEMELETLKILKEQEYDGYRKIVAESHDVTSELLNEMLRKEVYDKRFNNEDVKETILANPNFQMEEETLKVLVESVCWKDRLKAVRSDKISVELLESMYTEEDNESVRQSIEDNLIIRNKIFKENFTLNLAQKRKCIGILSEIREGRNKAKTLASYLQEILDIIV